MRRKKTIVKPMHKQPVYCTGAVQEVSPSTGSGTNVSEGFKVSEGPKMAAYVNGVSEALFKVGMCLPAGPYVSDEDVRYIVESIKEAIVG